MPKPPQEAEEDLQLLTWDPADGTDEEEDFDDELPADELFAGEDEEFLDDEYAEEEEVEELEEVVADGYTAEKPPEIPQPDRAKSHPTLPRVKSTSFKRIIR